MEDADRNRATVEAAEQQFQYWTERREAPLSADLASFVAGYQAATLQQTINARVRYGYPGSGDAWFHFTGTGKELLDVFGLSICSHFPVHWLTVDWTDWHEGRLMDRHIGVAESQSVAAT